MRFFKNLFLPSLILICLLATTQPVRLAQAQDVDEAASGERDASETDAPRGIVQIIFSGGPIGFLIILLLLSLSMLAAYLVFENVLSIRRDRIIPPELGGKVRKALSAGRADVAEKACREEPSLLAFVLSAGMSEIEGGDWSAVEKGLEDALAEQAARLFRRVEYLSVIGNIAPMVGLLGTVTGMIIAFQQVADSQGAAGAGQLAQGIYQALVTTVGGLIVAIPCLGAFAIFRSRIDQIVAEAAYAAQHSLGPLKRSRSRAAGAVPPPPPAS